MLAWMVMRGDIVRRRDGTKRWRKAPGIRRGFPPYAGLLIVDLGLSAN